MQNVPLPGEPAPYTPSVEDTRTHIPERRPSGRSGRRSPSVVSVRQVPPRHGAATPFPADLGDADQERERVDRLHEVQRRLEDAALLAQEAEDEREAEFRRHEEDREQIFLDAQERRDQEARERAEGVWQELDTRIAALEPPPPPPPPPPTVPPAESLQDTADDRASIASIRTATAMAVSQHSREIEETIRAEREESARIREEEAAERQRLLEVLLTTRDEQATLMQDKDARIKALEDELAGLRNELAEEKQQRATEEAMTREEERRDMIARDEAARAQLEDITNLVQEQRALMERNWETMEVRRAEKEEARQSKDAILIELRDIVSDLHNNHQQDRNKAEEARQLAESKPGKPFLTT